jgi:dolichol-phosphate mannosyltransferase
VITILLPAYNEEKSLPPLLDRIEALGAPAEIASHRTLAMTGEPYQVIIVNDGSRDGTASIAEQYARRMPLRLINHDGNKGLGTAMKTGFAAAARLVSDSDAIVTMDADNTHDPSLIEAMRAELNRGFDLVIASRYQKGGQEIGLSLARHIFSKGASTLLRAFFPIAGARDYTCGYRIYSGALIRRAVEAYGDDLVEEQGFTCMAEILIKMARLGARVSEVPLVLRYDRKEGSSKMNVQRTIRRYFVLIAHNWRAR